jgi:hypothetical protein
MTHRRPLVSMLITCALVLPAFADEAPLPTPVVSSANTKVLVQRGADFLPPTVNMPLQQTDRIVVLEGGSLQVGCDGSAVATFNEAGVFPVPACPARVAAAPAAAPAPAPATTPAATASSGSSSKTTLAVVGGAAVLGLAAAAGGGGGGGNKPVSP